jgi:hypothetical protein
MEARTKSRIAAVVIGALAILWGLMLFVYTPMLFARKIEGLLGHDIGTVREQLGPATKEWLPADFVCEPKFPCNTANAQGGDVLMYSDGNQAWYLYFDATGKLAALEPVRPDAGTRR